MIDRVEYLTNASGDEHVSFMEYSRKRKNYPFPIFVIEGKDDPKFYSGILRVFFGHEWDFISVGGKSKVLAVRQMIKQNPTYAESPVTFLVDKDFDSTEAESDLYVTPSYSIENIYCHPKTFEKILIAECGLSNFKIEKREEIKNILVNEYIKLQKNFHECRSLIVLNAMYFFSKSQPMLEIGADDILKIEIKFKSGCIEIKSVRKKRYKELIGRRLDISKFIRNSDKWVLLVNDPINNFRGKQEFLFLKEAVSQLKAGGYFHSLIKEKFGFSLKIDNPAMSDHLISTASQYVSPPNCLTDFLQKFKDKLKN